MKSSIMAPPPNGEQSRFKGTRYTLKQIGWFRRDLSHAMIRRDPMEKKGKLPISFASKIDVLVDYTFHPHGLYEITVECKREWAKVTENAEHGSYTIQLIEPSGEYTDFLTIAYNLLPSRVDIRHISTSEEICPRASTLYQTDTFTYVVVDEDIFPQLGRTAEKLSLFTRRSLFLENSPPSEDCNIYLLKEKDEEKDADDKKERQQKRVKRGT